MRVRYTDAGFDFKLMNYDHVVICNHVSIMLVVMISFGGEETRYFGYLLIRIKPTIHTCFSRAKRVVLKCERNLAAWWPLEWCKEYANSIAPERA